VEVFVLVNKYQKLKTVVFSFNKIYYVFSDKWRAGVEGNESRSKRPVWVGLDLTLFNFLGFKKVFNCKSNYVSAGVAQSVERRTPFGYSNPMAVGSVPPAAKVEILSLQ
jgi:hypothetical protein